MARPTRWRPRCCGNWAPISFRSASSPTASTSISNAARPRPKRCARKVREVRADFGIALDGDADRVVMADEHGQHHRRRPDPGADRQSWSKNGDAQGRRRGRHGDVECRAGPLSRRAWTSSWRARSVGDRYVIEEMNKGGFNVGGEQSGHIVLSDFSTTGDGLIAALQVLAVIAQEGQAALGRPRICSNRCRRCWRMCASRRARRSKMRG